MVIPLPQAIDNPFFIEKPIEISAALCDEWEAIERTGTGFYDFAEKHALLPPTDPLGKVNMYRVSAGLSEVDIDVLNDEDYIGIRDMLNLAAKLRHLSIRGNVTEEELNECGIRLQRHDKHILESYGLSLLSFWGVEATISIRGRVYIRYLADMLPYGSDIDDVQPAPTDSFTTDIGCYKLEDYLDNRFAEWQGRRITFDNDGFHYRLSLPASWQGADADAVGCFDHVPGEVLDALCEIHLHEVQTVTKNGIPYQAARWGICALWLAYCNKFVKARITTCKTCGAPILVTEERGTLREYCGERCRSWKKRHPGEMRGLRTKLSEGVNHG